MIEERNRLADETILYLPRCDVNDVLEVVDAVGVVRRALIAHAEGRAVLPPESYLSWETPDGTRARSLAMAGAIDGSIGTKIINANPSNVQAGLPRADGLTLLFDPVTARVRAVLAAAPLSAIRTAAVTVIGARTLGAPSIRTAALIGAGELAAAHLVLLTAELPDLREVRIFDVDAGRAEALAARFGDRLREREVRASVARNAQGAIRGSSLVVPVTTTVEGYIHPSWLSPGALLVHVSLDDALPEVVLEADRVFVDDLELVRRDERRLFGRMIRADLLGSPGEEPPERGRAIDGTLGQVLTGAAPGRLKDEDVIVLNPFGMAITDVALATAVAEVAIGKGMGIALPR